VPIFFDYDAETGIRETFDYDPIQDRVMITATQDVTGFLDLMNEIRKHPEISAKGMKEEWWHYASIPPVVEMELKKKGLDLNNKDHMKPILREINANYPYLKSTTKNHS
jgi:hypothetical protein